MADSGNPGVFVIEYNSLFESTSMEDFLNEFLGESQESVDEEVFLPDISKHGRMEDDYSSLSMSPTVSNQDRSSDRDLEDIIPDTPESTLRLNTGMSQVYSSRRTRDTLKKFFSSITSRTYNSQLKNCIKRLTKKKKKFRIEGAVQKELNVIAKAAFGTDIFNVSDCFIDEIKQLIQLEMSRTPTALEVRMAKQHIRKKFSMEYRPAMYRTRIVQRRGNIVTGTFWTKVRNLYDSVEEKIPARKLAIYEAFQQRMSNYGKDKSKTIISLTELSFETKKNSSENQTDNSTFQ
ncbi:Hypothetical predicted protein, partial [Mytilus galloprovincialis]